MYQDFFRQYLSSTQDAMLSMQRDAEKGIRQWAKMGGLGDIILPREPATEETPSASLKAELDSLKEKLKELEKKLGS